MKKIFYFSLFFSFVMIFIFNLSFNIQKGEEQTNLMLNNIEALAQSEGSHGGYVSYQGCFNEITFREEDRYWNERKVWYCGTCSDIKVTDANNISMCKKEIF